MSPNRWRTHCDTVDVTNQPYRNTPLKISLLYHLFKSSHHFLLIPELKSPIPGNSCMVNDGSRLTRWPITCAAFGIYPPPRKQTSIFHNCDIILIRNNLPPFYFLLNSLLPILLSRKICKERYTPIVGNYPSRMYYEVDKDEVSKTCEFSIYYLLPYLTL